MQTNYNLIKIFLNQKNFIDYNYTLKNNSVNYRINNIK